MAHAPHASWVSGANDPAGDFPLANLPFGVAERPDRPGEPRIVVAIGDCALDLAECGGFGLLDGLPAHLVAALRTPTLNAFMASGPAEWSAVRAHVAAMLSDGPRSIREHARRDAVLLPRKSLAMRLPAAIGDYTDFYASEHHATNVGSMFRPNQPLMPNWKHLPVGYHGRASSFVVDGTPVRRPHGQTSATDDGPPAFGPIKLMDYELEVGVFLGGRENPIGTRVPVARAAERLFGCVIVNDWSARDVQKWEYQPLGPFNAKNFATSISPWVVTLEALTPYAVPGPARKPTDPPVLPYLHFDGDFVLDVTLEVLVSSAAMREQGDGPDARQPGQLHRDVLVDEPDAGAPFLDGLQHAARRPTGQRHDQRPHEGEPRLPAGAHVARHRADHAGRRHRAPVPAGRRRGRHARLVRAPGPAADRLRRVPGRGAAGRLRPLAGHSHVLPTGPEPRFGAALAPFAGFLPVLPLALPPPAAFFGSPEASCWPRLTGKCSPTQLCG